MIYEKLPIRIDIHRLNEFFFKKVLPLPPEMVSEHFGGWAVLSSDGSYRDGFTQKTFVYDGSVQTMDQVKDELVDGKVKTFHHYNRPTELYQGYVKEIVETLSDAGLYPRRVRFMLLKAGGSCAMHRDNPDWLYGVRLHIPILTNPDCFFETEDEGAAHLASDGSVYLLAVNRMHRVVNRGTTHRVHLIASVHDTKGISQFHRYTEAHKQAVRDHLGQKAAGNIAP